MNNRPRPTLIQSGLSTHTQDQSMVSVSLRVMNTTVNRPEKEIPFEFDLLDIIALSFNYSINISNPDDIKKSRQDYL